ncbi:MAG: hypothetical protein H7Y18_08715 [Clostridiaceae bacterium]|nr:hypothetical protein [Clostridiaceae bacterium]
MIIFKKNLSLFLTFMFLISMLPKLDIKAKADSLPLPAADLSVTLVGNFIKLNELGEDWLETNAQTLMKEYKGGIYEFTVNFKAAMPLGEYKVVLNRSWDEGYGNGTENKKINVTAPGKVIIRYNSKTKTVYDSINDPLQFKSAANLVGYFLQCGGKDWDPADTTYALDYMGGGFYKKTFTLKAGTYEYKTAYNSGWNQGEVADNVKISLTKDTEVTFIANPLEGICTDSINTPLILGSVSLIGTIRNVGDPANTDITSKGFDFSNLTGDGKYIYSGFFKEGSYQYKGLENYAWTSGGLPAGANIDITIPKGGKYVVFIGDRAARTMIDSVNNPALVTEALGLKPVPVVPVELRSPVVNNNGTVTFNYMDATATKVCLAGSMNAWSATSIPMAKTDTEKNIWSVTVTLANPAKVYEYKFVVDGILKQDPLNIPKTGDNSILNYTGRKIVLAGTIQTIAGDKANWDPTSVNTKLNFDGNGNYSLTLKNVPIGNYEYKIAMGSWDENYGADGIRDGANIKLVVPVQEDITFWYNDISHKIADSTYYKQVNVDLKGTGIPADTKLTDKSLTGVYSTTVNLKIGTYSDIKAVLEAKEYSFGKVVVSTDKDVTFSIDTKSLMTFSDASDIKVAVDKLYFNSRDSEYKSPYGATPTDTDITFNLKTGTDVTTAKIVMITSKGIKLIDMTANSTNDKWTGHFSSSTLGQFKYYFVVSNGSDLKAYGDDDGFFGPGKAGQLGTVGNYDLNIYDKNFKTPDWMKNAVVYQIFPDRFSMGILVMTMHKPPQEVIFLMNPITAGIIFPKIQP